MLLKSNLRNGAIALGFLAFLPAGGFLGNLYDNHNIHQVSRTGDVVMRKVDGLVSHTELEKDSDGATRIGRYGGLFSTTSFYRDSDGDLKVDTVHIMPSGRNSADEFFDRNKDFQ